MSETALMKKAEPDEPEELFAGGEQELSNTLPSCGKQDDKKLADNELDVSAMTWNSAV